MRRPSCTRRVIAFLVLLILLIIALKTHTARVSSGYQHHHLNDYYDSLQSAIESLLIIDNDYIIETNQPDVGANQHATTSNHDQKYLILPVDVLGLANRLRIIASVYAIYQHHQRVLLASNGTGTIELIVIWVSSVECPVLFHEVFDGSSVHVISLDHEVLDAYSTGTQHEEEEEDRRRSFEFSLRKVIANIVSKSSNPLRLKEMHLRSFVVDDDDFEWNLIDVHLLWTRGTHVIDSVYCNEYLRLKSMFYRSLTPSIAVSRLMSTVDIKYDQNYNHRNQDTHDHREDEDDYDNNDNEMVIGVHVRAFDSSYDWEVVNPIQKKAQLVYNNITNNFDVFIIPSTTVGVTPDDSSSSSSSSSSYSSAKRFDQVQSIDVFIAFMNSMLTIYPTARFFIASNSMQVKLMIHHHFNQLGSNRILSVLPVSPMMSGGGHDRGTKEGMMIAVADFLLLGQTRLIAHTMGSSFGREAGCIHNVPVIDVTMWQHNNDNDGDPHQTVGVYFYSQHTALQHCSMPEYIRHYSHEKYLSLSTAVLESEDVVISSLGGDRGPVERVDSHLMTPVCHDDGGRMMCTMPYLICLCSDTIGDDSNRSIHTHAGVYCYLDPFDTSTVYRTRPFNECYMLLAESNGYTL